MGSSQTVRKVKLGCCTLLRFQCFVCQHLCLHQVYYYVLRAKSLQSSRTFCDPMDCSLPGSSVHGIFLERTLEWVPFPSSRDLPDSGIKSTSLTSLALAGRGFFTATVAADPDLLLLPSSTMVSE